MKNSFVQFVSAACLCAGLVSAVHAGEASAKPIQPPPRQFDAALVLEETYDDGVKSGQLNVLVYDRTLGKKNALRAFGLKRGATYDEVAYPKAVDYMFKLCRDMIVRKRADLADENGGARKTIRDYDIVVVYISSPQPPPDPASNIASAGAN